MGIMFRRLLPLATLLRSGIFRAQALSSLRPSPSLAAQLRGRISIGAVVDVVRKEDQRTGTLTRGRVARHLTKSPRHPRGIKVMLEAGIVGRVHYLVDADNDTPGTPEDLPRRRNNNRRRPNGDTTKLVASFRDTSPE